MQFSEIVTLFLDSYVGPHSIRKRKNILMLIAIQNTVIFGLKRDYKKRSCPWETWINLLKPTGYVLHHQFNIQQL
jgi:hypothetical protein